MNPKLIISTHTPTPWRVIAPAGNFTKYTLTATESGQPFKHGDEIADVMDKDNADFIVRAVNMHQELLDLLRDVYGYSDIATKSKFGKRIDKAIAKAEGR